MGFYRLAGQTMWRRVAELGAPRRAPARRTSTASPRRGSAVSMSSPRRPPRASPRSSRTAPARPHSRRSEFVRLLLRDPQPPPDVLRTAAAHRRRRAGADGGAVRRTGRDVRGVRPLGARPDRARPPRGGVRGGAVRPGRPRAPRAPAAAAERTGTRLALGPAVPLRQARDAASPGPVRCCALMLAGLAGEEALASAEEHRLELLLGAEPRLAAEFAERRLAPLATVAGRGDAGEPRADAARMAALARPAQDDRPRAGRPPADRALPDDAAARAVRRAARRPRRALRAGAGAAAAAVRRARRRSRGDERGGRARRSDADGRHRQPRRPRCAHAAACRRARARRGCRRC